MYVQRRLNGQSIRLFAVRTHLSRKKLKIFTYQVVRICRKNFKDIYLSGSGEESSAFEAVAPLQSQVTQ
jgi:hypothetical protein